MKGQFTIGIFGTIFDKHKRVLLCHRTDYDLWNLPGGSDELPANISPKQAERIKDALAGSDKVIFKVQTGKSSIDLLKEGKLL